MTSEQLKQQIKKFYDENCCYAETNKCGENRTKISSEEYFPSPYPFIGENYNAPQTAGKAVPKIFILSVNQNLREKENNYSREEARDSLQPTDKEKLEVRGYGPLALTVSLGNIFYSCLLTPHSINFLPNKDILNNIAYSNCVRCGNPSARAGKPTQQMVENCKKFTEYEIKTLEPDLIFCIGRDPFFQIKNINLFQSESLIEDFYYQITINGKKIKVIYFYHYGNQQPVNAGAKMIKLFSKFHESAEQIIKAIKDTANKSQDIWRQQGYSEFAKFYSIQIIKHVIDNIA